MIIDCPECNKKFDIDQNLIPHGGRLLQCGSCNHKWFFKLNIDKKIEEEEIKIKPKTEKKYFPKKTIHKNEEKISTKIKDNKKTNYLNILLVIILSIIAFILVLETFKHQLTSIFPNINFLLNNLYQSIEDIKLFTIDLIK